ncbi:MAG: TolC family protein, partial [Synechococcales bacterium]|nr:TolC family protein [Synechococcales bacterium]
MQPAHRNFLVASLGVVVVLGPIEPGFAQPAVLSASSRAFANHPQQNPLLQDRRSPVSPTWHVRSGPAPLVTDEIELDWSFSQPAADGAIASTTVPNFALASAVSAEASPEVTLPLVEPTAPEVVGGLEWVPMTPKQKVAAPTADGGGTGSEEPDGHALMEADSPQRTMSRGETDLAQADLDDSDVVDPALPDAETGDIDLDPDDDLVEPIDPLEEDPLEDPVLDADPLDRDTLEEDPLDTDPDGIDVEVDIVPDPEEPIIDPQPEEINPPDEELDDEVIGPGSAEDLVPKDPTLADPEMEFDDTVESLRSPANPLFFPTNPEVLEVGAIVPLTLEQALELARLNSREYEVVRLQIEQARANLREQRAELFPQITAQGTLVHSETTTFAEPELPTVSPNDLTNVFTGTVRLDYDIFSFGERRALIRAAEEAIRLQELQLEVVSEEIRLATTEAYYELQDTDELVRIAEDTLEESLISLRDAEARERAGVGTRFDRLQAEVDVANSQQDLREAVSNQLIAQRQIAEILSLPPG